MTKEAFYNRTDETKQLVSIVNDKKVNNRIVIIHGKSGVGKSAFVDNVLTNGVNRNSSIRVNICKTSSGTIDNLYYINALYRQIASLAKKRPFDKLYSPLQFGVLNIKNLLSIGLEALIGKSIGSSVKLYEPIQERSIVRKKDYIISILQKGSFIVTIDNAQDIDVQSFELLIEIIKNINESVFVFEYTSKSNEISDELLTFYNTLRKHFSATYLIEIKALSFEYAKKIISEDVEDRLKFEMYKRSNGNLVKLKLADNPIDLDIDPVESRLSQLSKDELFLINILYLNESPIRYEDLYDMLIGNLNAPPFSEQSLAECLLKLEKKRIIRFIDMDMIRLYHDTIASQLDLQSTSVTMYSAYGLLKEYYSRLLNEAHSEDAAAHLFSIYLRFSDEELVLIFSRIIMIVRNFKYPYSIIKKLISYREKVLMSTNLNPRLYKKLVELLTALCIDLKLYDEAAKNLDLIYSSNNPYHRALKAAVLSLDYTNDNSIVSIKTLIKQATSPRERLTSELCLLSAEMAVQSRSNSIIMAKEMIDKTEYCDYLEYAFLLSNYAELVTDTKECIFFYNKAIRHFRLSGRDDLCANVLVFLSMVRAYEGQISAARKILSKAEQSGKVCEYIILNNKAVLDILEHKTNAVTAKNLSDSLLLTDDTYERILIQSNLLVCYTLLLEYERAEQIMTEITSQDYELFKYEEFLHIVYQNLYFFSSSTNRVTEADYYRKKLEELIINGSSSSMFFPIAKLQIVHQSSEEYYYSKFPFRVDFLGSWNIEISSELENY